MSKKSRSRNLIILFVVLLAVVAIIKYFDSIKGERSFKSKIISIDTAKVTSINIYPEIGASKQAKKALKIVRLGDSWRVKNDSIDVQLDNQKVKEMLSSLVLMKPYRVAGIDKSKWNEFKVTDSAATKVEVFDNKKCLADFYLGKYSYKKPKNNYYNTRGTMYTYVRLADDNITYCVKGFLKMLFSTDLRFLRDDYLCRLKKSNINKLVFSFPDNSSFSLIKQKNKWLISGIEADSANTAKYINSLAYISSSNFIKNENKIKLPNPDYMLKIEGDNFTPEIIKAFNVNDKIIITSSRNKGSKFDGEKNNLFKKIFVKKEHFLRKSKKSKKIKNKKRK